MWCLLAVFAPPDESSSGHDAGEEARLVERCRSGDLDAFDLLVARHQNRVYNLCFWMLHDADEASDAAQDVFVRAFRSFHTFRGDSRISTWLHRIAVNVALDRAAKRKKAPMAFSSLPLLPGEDVPDDPEPSGPILDNPADIASRRERAQLVRQALARLPEHFRVVLVLYDIEGHSYDEVGTIVGLPMGTVKSRLFRARDALRKGLESHRELFEGA